VFLGSEKYAVSHQVMKLQYSYSKNQEDHA